jgi:hypothetical protein
MEARCQKTHDGSFNFYDVLRLLEDKLLEGKSVASQRAHDQHKFLIAEQTNLDELGDVILGLMHDHVYPDETLLCAIMIRLNHFDNMHHYIIRLWEIAIHHQTSNIQMNNIALNCIKQSMRSTQQMPFIRMLKYIVDHQLYDKTTINRSLYILSKLQHTNISAMIHLVDLAVKNNWDDTKVHQYLIASIAFSNRPNTDWVFKSFRRGDRFGTFDAKTYANVFIAIKRDEMVDIEQAYRFFEIARNRGFVNEQACEDMLVRLRKYGPDYQEMIEYIESCLDSLSLMSAQEDKRDDAQLEQAGQEKSCDDVSAAAQKQDDELATPLQKPAKSSYCSLSLFAAGALAVTSAVAMVCSIALK